MYRHAHWYVLVIAVASLAGFVPTYVQMLERMHLAHHLHFWLSAAWLALLCYQAWLASRMRLSRHRTLGILGVGIFVGFYASSMYVTWYSGGFAGEQGMPLSLLLWFDTLALQFALLTVVLAIIHRSDVGTHQRLMVATALVVVVPGFGRTVGAFLLAPMGLPGFLFPIIVFGTLLLGTSAWAWVDRFRSPVTLSVLGVTLLLVVSTLAIGGSDWWRDVLRKHGNPVQNYESFRPAMPG